MIFKPEGINTARPSLKWWVTVAFAVAILVVAPKSMDMAMQFDVTSIFVYGILAISMGFLWGSVGILSFGQTIFFGLGGYAYTLLVLNIGVSLASVLGALTIGTAFALLLGYFIIYGRISDIYLSVITLVVTLIFEKSIRSTSGPEYVIGSVRLNGQNGIPGIPGLILPFTGGTQLSIEGMFWLAGGALIVCYVMLRVVLASRFGRILVGIRENERRMELLGYDTRYYRLTAFALAGTVAALAGVLFALWGSFIGPEIFGLNQAALIVIWVIVGGRSTLVGPIVGAAIVQYLSKWLGTVGVGQVPTILGAILIVTVLIFPQGLVPGLIRARGVASLLRARGKPGGVQ